MSPAHTYLISENVKCVRSKFTKIFSMVFDYAFNSLVADKCAVYKYTFDMLEYLATK